MLDVDAGAKFDDGGADGLAGVLEQVGGAGTQRLGMHPDDGGFEAGGLAGWRGDGGDHVAAAEIDFVFEREDDGLRRMGAGEIAVEGGDGADAGAAAAGQRDDFVAGMNWRRR